MDEFWAEKFSRLKANGHDAKAIELACSHLFYPGASGRAAVLLRKRYKIAPESERPKYFTAFIR